MAIKAREAEVKDKGVKVKAHVFLSANLSVGGKSRMPMIGLLAGDLRWCHPHRSLENSAGISEKKPEVTRGAGPGNPHGSPPGLRSVLLSTLLRYASFSSGFSSEKRRN